MTDNFNDDNFNSYQQPAQGPAPQYYNVQAVQPHKRPLSFWIAVLLGFFLFFSFIFNIILLATVGKVLSVQNLNGVREEFISGDAASQNKIAVIDINGVIMSGEAGGFLTSGYDTVEKINSELGYVEDDDAVKAVILRINSPGGAITACDAIYDRIKRFRQKRPDVKITAFYETVSASGGYYISAGADTIIASPTCITGSIGVIMSFYNLEDLYQKIGLKDVVLKTGEFKDIGSSSRPMTDSERQLLQEMLEQMYQRFLNVIAEGRKKLTPDSVKALADGRIFTGEQAKQNGLVDETGYFNDAVDAAEKAVGIHDARVIKYGKIPSFIETLFGASEKKITVDSVASELHKLFLARTPQMMYLWRVE